LERAGEGALIFSATRRQRRAPGGAILAGMSRPFPLRVDPDALADATVTALVRTCIAAARYKLDKTVPPAEFARRTWGDESRSVEFLLRAASSPAQITVSVSQEVGAGALHVNAGEISENPLS
jgi:hypothetical protein